MTSAFIRTALPESQTFKGKNRRAAQRYAVRATLQYRVRDFNSTWKSGQTLDVSVGGILIDTSGAVPVGSTLELVIDWVGLYHGVPGVRLLVTGSVVRNDGRGTALRILSHEFRDVRAAVIPARRTERNRAVA